MNSHRSDQRFRLRIRSVAGHRGQSRLSMGVLVLVSSCAVPAPMPPPVPPVAHVVILGIDGLSPDGIRNAKTPVLDRLMREGAYTLHARAVLPTDSSPNWASMMRGAGPEQHGVTSNDWRPGKHDGQSTTNGTGEDYPTIFAVLRNQRPRANIVCIYDWSGFGRLFDHKAVDFVEDALNAWTATRRTVACFKSSRPELCVLHVNHVDMAGHLYGYGTQGYYRAVEAADQLLGKLLAGLDAAGMRDTAVLVLSDHGGRGHSHGGSTMEEIEIPWILWGSGVARGREIRAPVEIYDTAPTVAMLLGLQPHESWIGKPVREAFDHPPGHRSVDEAELVGDR